MHKGSTRGCANEGHTDWQSHVCPIVSFGCSLDLRSFLNGGVLCSYIDAQFIKTCRQKIRKADKQKDRQADRQGDREAGKETRANRETSNKKCEQANKQTHRQPSKTKVTSSAGTATPCARELRILLHLTLVARSNFASRHCCPKALSSFATDPGLTQICDYSKVIPHN